MQFGSLCKKRQNSQLCDWVRRLINKRSTSVIVRSGVFKRGTANAKRLTKQRSANVRTFTHRASTDDGKMGSAEIYCADIRSSQSQGSLLQIETPETVGGRVRPNVSVSRHVCLISRHSMVRVVKK